MQLLIPNPHLYFQNLFGKHSLLRIEWKTLLLATFSIFVFGSAASAGGPTIPLVTDPPPEVDANDSDYQAGFLNVTKAPYNADPTGTTDATQAIQDAIDDARDYHLACFFPSGTYLISDTIEGKQLHLERTRPCVLIGSTVGPRPVIKLKNNANGFNGANWKAAVIMWTQSGSSNDPSTNDGNSNFNQLFSGIDIDLGSGNDNAVGIWFTASQGSSLENVKIYSASGNFYAGMFSAPGQGGGTYNVEVVGGQYGYYGVIDSRFPMLAGCRFIDQTVAPVHYTGRQALVFVGCFFKNSNEVPIDMSTASTSDQRISFVDCIVEGSGMFIDNTKKKNIYMENVYFKGITTVIKSASTNWDISDSSVWTCVDEYSYCRTSTFKNIVEEVPNTTTNTNEYKTKTENSGNPPTDLLTTHIWDETTAPSFEDSDAVNVKTDLGANNAAGDGITDDTASLQYAIDNYDKVFVPKGTYRLTSSLVLHSNTQFFGVPTCITRIAPRSSWNPATNQSLITTDNDADAVTVLTRFYIDLHPDRPNLTPVIWKAGRKSVVSHFLIGIEDGAGGQSINAEYNALHIKDNGGGRWRCVCGAWQSLAPLSENQNSRLLLIENTSEPLHWYAVNTERSLAAVQGEIRNSSNVSFYYYKSEADSMPSGGGGDAVTTLLINNSDNIALYGVSGSITLDGDLPVVDVIDSDDVVLTHIRPFGNHDFLTVREDYFGLETQLTTDNGLAFFLRGSPSRIAEGILYTPETNLVLNPSFENWDSGDPCIDWELNGTTAPQVTNTGGDPDLDGNRHVYISPTADFLRIQQWVPITAGKSYTVSGNVRLTGDLQGGGGASIQVKFYESDKSTAVGGSTDLNSNNLFGNQDWTEYKTTGLTAGSSAAYLRIRLICDGANTNSNAKARFDLISVVEE